MLRGYGMRPKSDTNHASVADLIRMPLGKEKMEHLKTPVLLLAGSHSYVYWLIGGVSYFKLRR